MPKTRQQETTKPVRTEISETRTRTWTCNDHGIKPGTVTKEEVYNILACTQCRTGIVEKKPLKGRPPLYTKRTRCTRCKKKRSEKITRRKEYIEKDRIIQEKDIELAHMRSKIGSMVLNHNRLINDLKRKGCIEVEVTETDKPAVINTSS
jgi:hypothetical protein